MVFSGARLTSWGEGAYLALLGHPSSDGVKIKIPYGVFYINQFCTPTFPIGLVKTESDLTVSTVETDLGR